MIKIIFVGGKGIQKMALTCLFNAIFGCKTFHKKIEMFLFFAKIIDLGNLLEPPLYTQSLFGAKIRKIICTFINSNLTISKWAFQGS